ncbi:conjugal transfer protein TraN [Vibrio alginolyticus]|uniref:conjugal transfer protein TraN n=1 Tax=Vibrio sp. 1167 TaxID=3074546 RepID=UPI00146EA171|nr:conjugal transfer protein TraN [Vibrio sp. 1167]MDW2302547.1 conjugal transfer protein TraN [Vibrio sp. 1167]NMT94263.1 conjugal transfer protein TraN [Vibrio alginolyticus]
MLRDRFDGFVGQLISYVVMITTTLLPLRMAYAQQEFDQAVVNANSFAQSMLNQRANPTYDAEGNLLVDGQVYMSQKQITGQRDNDYLPAGVDVYGSDAQTIMQGQAAQKKYEEKTLATAETSGERAYHILKKSISNQKPDLANDPIWAATDDVFNNLEEIAQDFANCTIDKELVSNGKSYHVPVYKTCERLPAIEDNYSIFHEYEVGVIKHHSGATNIASCGDGCTTLWLGTIGNNYWSGNCTIYEQQMQVEVIQPQAIQSAIVDYAKFDDWFQIHLNGEKVYNGPYPDQFPPETDGRCELSNSWVKRPNINVLNSFRSTPEKGILTFKNRTSVSGEGEGYAKITINYDASDLVYAESWSDQELIDKAYAIKKQADDGFCEASFTCANMPASVDENGCAVINGIRVCEENFDDNPLSDLGISPFCQRIDIESNCGFNEGQICTTNIEGVETCFDNDTVENNQCAQYENDSTCSYIKTECVEGAEGASGECYVQLDTYDCGFDASTGTTHEEEVLRCDGQIQCIGESCYSPDRDLANNDFGEVNAYLEMLRYAQADMTCEGIPERPFDPVNPPDRYEPIPSCPAGSVYDKISGKCLTQTACTYSDNDFFAVSRRDGIQVLLSNMVVANEPSVLTCTTLIKNGTAYTCGEARKNVGTDTFYEVCTNTVSEPTPNTCPSDEHELNENTGYCEVPPIVTCPDGFVLVQGSDMWSSEDDVCRLETPVTYNCDKSHEYYNPETGVCDGLLYDVATCDDPMNLENDICTATLTDDVQCPSGQSFISSQEVCSQTLVNNATCPSGSSLENDRCNGLLVEQAECPSGQALKNGVCTVTLSQPAGCPAGQTLQNDVCTTTLTDSPKCPSGQSFNTSTGQCSQTIFNDAQCPSGSSLSNDRCNGLLVQNARCPSGQSLKNGVCTVTLNKAPSCSSGYTYNASKDRCEKTTSISITQTCQNGFSLVGGICKKEDVVNAIENCPSNSQWNEQKRKCEVNVCEYNSGTFYFHNRYGGGGCWLNGKEVSCSNYSIGGRVKEENMNTFFELCYKGYISKNVECPSGYTYKEGFCSKTTTHPPIKSCPSGYTQNGSKCDKTQITSPLCQSGYGYNFSTNKCEKTVNSSPMCETGYSFNLSTNKCEKEIDAAPICSSGYSYDPVSNKCKKTVESTPFCQSGYQYNDDLQLCTKHQTSSPLCQSGYGYNLQTNQCEKTVNSNPICETGYGFNLTTNKCEKEIDAAPICTSGYSYDPVSNKCKKIVESEPQCQTGYEYYDGLCYKEISSAPNCPDGYAYSTITGQCELKTSSQPRLSCDTEGTSYYAPTNTCRLDIEAEQSCPSSFPVWSDDENRCMSGSLSPLAKVRTKLESNAGIDANNPNEAQALIAYAVAPFSHLASALMPTAYAEEVAEPEDSVTQDTMNAYIGEKFEYAAQTFDYQKAMFAQGQSQLLGMMSSSAPSDGQGTTNVQCELFKGEAMECKQAVGGMQDCCESPVTVSLGDYITLTRHMMSMDSLTGQVFGLDGYTGVWDIASNWTSEAASTAFDAVQSTFTSGADVVAQQGTEAVGEGAVNAMAQSMMTYTNAFLTEAFGPEVAGMFFQQAGTDAAGNAVLGASPQMAAAGQALMYCYYAYLAYVVFNLLVNIVFACEEEELDLAMKVELLSAHYLGSYCKTEVLGACIEKRKSYCAYDSPLSRILMEQIYQQPQMGLSWGSAKNPNCSGLSIEDIGNVDWDQVNLDEWVGILIETDNFIQNDVIDIERLTGSGSLLNYGDTTETERQNVLEKNTDRFDDIDVDEVRRDAYEDAWNEQQN